jgi:hypothetical protein
MKSAKAKHTFKGFVCCQPGKAVTTSGAVKLLPLSPQPIQCAIDEDPAALARSPAEAFLFAPAKISNLSVVQGTLKLLMRLNRVGIQYPL